VPVRNLSHPNRHRTHRVLRTALLGTLSIDTEVKRSFPVTILEGRNFNAYLEVVSSRPWVRRMRTERASIYLMRTVTGPLNRLTV